MNKYVLSMVAIFATLPLALFAQIESCGDGNQRYSLEKNGDTVRYFASVNDFNVSRVSESKVIVEDKVACRYGKDTLLNITTVTFLDQSMSLNELVIHDQQKNLSLAILRSLLYDKVAQQVSSRGVNPFAETSQLETNQNTSEQVEISNNTSYGSGESSSRFIPNANSMTSSYTPGQYSREQSSSYGSGANSYSSSYYSPSSNSSYQSSYGAYNTGYQNQQYNTTYVSPYTSNNYSGGIANASAGRVEISWTPNQVSPNEIIYFEATANGNEHHYLGSAVGYQGRKMLDIPSFLGQEEQLTIYLKSGARLIKTIELEL